MSLGISSLQINLRRLRHFHQSVNPQLKLVDSNQSETALEASCKKALDEMVDASRKQFTGNGLLTTHGAWEPPGAESFCESFAIPILVESANSRELPEERSSRRKK